MVVPNSVTEVLRFYVGMRRSEFAVREQQTGNPRGAALHLDGSRSPVWDGRQPAGRRQAGLGDGCRLAVSCARYRPCDMVAVRLRLGRSRSG